MEGPLVDHLYHGDSIFILRNALVCIEKKIRRHVGGKLKNFTIRSVGFL